MIVLSAIQAVALLPLLLVHDRHGLAIVYAVIVAQSSLRALFDPAKNALLPALVDPWQLVSANSLVGLGTAVARLAGGPLGGLLLAAGSLRTIVVADALSFGVAGLLIARLPRRAAARGRARRRCRCRCGSAAGGLGCASCAPARSPLRCSWRSSPTPPRASSWCCSSCSWPGGCTAGQRRSACCAASRPSAPSPAGLLLARAWGPLAAARSRRGERPSPSAIVDLTIWNGPLVTRSEAVYVALFVCAGAPGVIMETAGDQLPAAGHRRRRARSRVRGARARRERRSGAGHRRRRGAHRAAGPDGAAQRPGHALPRRGSARAHAREEGEAVPRCPPPHDGQTRRPRRWGRSLADLRVLQGGEAQVPGPLVPEGVDAGDVL